MGLGVQDRSGGIRGTRMLVWTLRCIVSTWNSGLREPEASLLVGSKGIGHRELHASSARGKGNGLFRWTETLFPTFLRNSGFYLTSGNPNCSP